MGGKHGKNSSNKSSRNPSVDTPSSEDEADGYVRTPRNSQKGRKNSKKMPLFRSQSEKAKKREQHLQYLVCML